MKIRKKIHFLCLTFFLASFLTPLAFANENASTSGELKEGSYLPVIQIADQFGNAWQIQEKPKKLFLQAIKMHRALFKRF